MRDIPDNGALSIICLGEGVYISIYSGAFSGPQRSLSFKLSSVHYYNSSKEFTVEGKDFWQCVEEYKHRKAFAEQQEKLMLGAPTIEAENLPQEDRRSLSG